MATLYINRSNLELKSDGNPPCNPL